MNINPINSINAIAKYKFNTIKSEENKVQNASSDKVELSADAKVYLDAMKKANKSDDIRLDKVNEIKRRIEAGTYSVDSYTVAKSILNESRLDIEI